MIIDANEIEKDALVECDLCIIGAGAAGITLAREFDGSGLNVWLLESGSFDYEQDTQDLYKGSTTGRDYHPLDRTRLRYLGGTTNHWTGICRPLDEIDFQKRDWIPHSGWPFDRDHLTPWYQRAQVLCQLDDFFYDLAHWWPDNKRPSPFTNSSIRTIVSQFSPPTRFGSVYRDEIKKSRNITLCLHANVTHLQADNLAPVLKHLRIETLERIQFTLQPRLTVLACGGIENARLLLASNDIESNGLGNQHDLVGRFFMDHLVLQWGGALLTTRRHLPGFWYSIQQKDRRRLPMPTLLLDDSLQHSSASGNYSASLGPPARPEGITSFRYLENKIRADSEIRRFWHHLGNIIGDIDDVSSSLYYRYFDSENAPIEPVLYQQWEQVPNPDSRIQLSAESDSLGMPRVRLNWSLNQLDHHTLLTGQQTLAREVGRLGIGRLRIDIDAQQAIPDTVEGDNHQLGTTRMHQSPRHGVVNENCRVHSVDNLFIAGGSVFPTGGSGNPTLTVVALALRLADYLKEQLA